MCRRKAVPKVSPGWVLTTQRDFGHWIRLHHWFVDGRPLDVYRDAGSRWRDRRWRSLTQQHLIMCPDRHCRTVVGIAEQNQRDDKRIWTGGSDPHHLDSTVCARTWCEYLTINTKMFFRPKMDSGDVKGVPTVRFVAQRTCHNCWSLLIRRWPSKQRKSFRRLSGHIANPSTSRS